MKVGTVDLMDVADEVAGRLEMKVQAEIAKLRVEGLSNDETYMVMDRAMEFLLVHLLDN